MRFMVGFLSIILTLLLVVGLHEAGHALAARIFKVKIQGISIGFGRPLLRWQDKQGIQWIWAIWPLGGYVRLCNSRIESLPKSAYPVCFDKKPVWVRCVILLAGAIANAIIAWLALVYVFCAGYQELSPIVQTITTPSVSSAAGLAAGDRILSLGGEVVHSWRDVGMQLLMRLGQPTLEMDVATASGLKRHLQLDFSRWKFQKSPSSFLEGIGITPDVSQHLIHPVAGLPFLESAQQAWLRIGKLINFDLVMVKQLTLGLIPFSLLLGPLGMFITIINSLSQGLTVFLYFIASLSVAVGLVNLFPIPGLDGGSIVYALVEKIRGKPVSMGMEILLQRLASVWLVIFLIQLILNDVRHYI